MSDVKYFSGFRLKHGDGKYRVNYQGDEPPLHIWGPDRKEAKIVKVSSVVVPKQEKRIMMEPGEIPVVNIDCQRYKYTGRKDVTLGYQYRREDAE